MIQEYQKKYFWIEVKGSSMFPFIKAGDRLLIEGQLPAEMQRGDIIALRVRGKIIVHRLIQKYLKGGRLFFREKGDRNLSSQIVQAQDILGRAVIIKGREKEKNLNQKGWRILNRTLAWYGFFLSLLYRIFQKLGLNKKS